MRGLIQAGATLWHGLLICITLALAATFLSEHYGGPQLLYALLLGLSAHFLYSVPSARPGIDFCARTILRCGVVLLAARITLRQIADLGWSTGVMVLLAVFATVLFGMWLAKRVGSSGEYGVLSGGAVAICGASAALAIASILPPTKANERFTLLVVVGVTVLSTVAMLIYPFLLQSVHSTPQQTGVFLGGTIHDVAQVVAAGLIVGPEAADTATVVKLFRVMLLMPVTLLIATLYRSAPHNIDKGDSYKKSPPLIPGFLLAFIGLILITSTGMIPPPVVDTLGQVSRGMLVIAIGAAGVKTAFAEMLDMGWQPVLILIGETLFIAGLMFIVLYSGLL